MKPRQIHRSLVFAAAFATSCLAAQAQEPLPGSDLQTLLVIAKERNPEYASMRDEADAAGERVTPAGALPDPRFRVELMDITKMGEQNPTLWPERRRQHQVHADAGTALVWQARPEARDRRTSRPQGRRARRGAPGPNWPAKIKIAHAQRLYLHRNRKLTREILDLMVAPGEDRPGALRRRTGGAAGRDPGPGRADQHAQRTDHAGDRSAPG